MNQTSSQPFKTALKMAGKDSYCDISLFDMVENIINGKDFASERVVPVILKGSDWDSQFSILLDNARRQGNEKRQLELEALQAFFRLPLHLSDTPPENILQQIEKVKDLCYKSDSPSLNSFVLGSLGTTLASYELEKESIDLTREACKYAKKCGLKLAELQWSTNLVHFSMKNDPRKADRELRRLLSMARDVGEPKMIGIILNNLAFINDKDLSNIEEAILFQEEAVNISNSMGDKANALHRTFHLAFMQERAGQIMSAIQSYDRGLALEAEIGLSSQGVEVIRRMSRLLADQYRDKTKEILSSQIKIKKNPISEKDIREQLEQAKFGGYSMSSWHPDTGSVTLVPENSIAKRLTIDKEWQALAVYAYHWMDTGFLVGDYVGFHWFAVTLRGLGYTGAADAALQMAMKMPKVFKEDPKSGDN